MGKKISSLATLSAPVKADYLTVVDISEAADADKNKKLLLEELFKGTKELIVHNPQGLIAEDVSKKWRVPPHRTGITFWGATARDADGNVVTGSHTLTAEFRQKAWSSGAWSDTVTGDKLTGTQIVFSSAAPSKLSTSPGLGALVPGQFLQIGILSIAAASSVVIHTLEVEIEFC